MLIVLYVKDEWSFDRFFQQSVHTVGLQAMKAAMANPTRSLRAQ